MSEFNGPCVLCLEPSEDSKIHIQAFREILRKKLFAKYDAFSPSSTVTSLTTLEKGLPRHILRQHGLGISTSTSTSTTSIDSNRKSKKKKREGTTFRPLITLGGFSTVTKAVEVARKLQKVWEPLKFRVSDLQLVSKLEASSIKTKIGEYMDLEDDDVDPYSIQVDEYGTPQLFENRELTLRKFHGSEGGGSILSSKGEYGCDAMVMLMGEEGQLLKKQEGNIDDSDSVDDSSSLYLDEEDEKKILKLLLSEAAIPGGQARDNSVGGVSAMVDSSDGDDDYLQNWLEEDEDVDEGATIIIGRTQFFMGELRQYTGMPASSTMDGKDRALGDNNVSGSARRRGAVHRQGDRWQDGDYGQKEKDKMP